MSNRNSIDFLKQYETLQTTCQIIDEQTFGKAKLLREIKREEGVEKTENVSRRVEKYASSLIEEINELTLRKRIIMSRINLIESVVNALSKKERTVIRRFFLSGGKHAADDLMEELEFEKTQVYRLRARALEMIDRIITNLPLSDCADDKT